MEFLIGFYELFSIAGATYNLFVLVKEPTSFGDQLGMYTLIQLVLASISGVSYLAIVGFLIKLAKDVEGITGGTPTGTFSFVMNKYIGLILNFLFLDTLPTVGDYFYLKTLE